jgi:HEPN domain-containing protein
MTYPGSAACAADLLSLANAYRRSAGRLLKDRRQSLACAPATLCAIHAIELYLNAFLLHRGSSPKEIRRHVHDLAGRGALVMERGLVLRRRTIEHLGKITRDREYLVSRYGPEKISTLSQVNRLIATMDEIARKVIAAVERPVGGAEQPASVPDPALSGTVTMDHRPPEPICPLRAVPGD